MSHLWELRLLSALEPKPCWALGGHAHIQMAFGMFFILLTTLAYTGGEHKLSQMIKHSKCFLLVSWEYRLFYIFFIFLNRPPPWTNTTINKCQISTLLIKSLSSETGPDVFSNLVLVLLPPCGTKVSGSGQPHTKVLHEKGRVTREIALCCFLILIAGPPSPRTPPQILTETIENHVV